MTEMCDQDLMPLDEALAITQAYKGVWLIGPQSLVMVRARATVRYYAEQAMKHYAEKAPPSRS